MSLLRNINDLVKLIKKAAIEAVNASDPTAIRYGEVINENPLQIRIDQKLILGEAQLKLTRNVTDFEVDMTMNHETESASGGSGYSEFAPHKHEYKGRKKFLVHNSLKNGEKVLLIRMQGGQQYIVVDRV